MAHSLIMGEFKPNEGPRMQRWQGSQLNWIFVFEDRMDACSPSEKKTRGQMLLLTSMVYRYDTQSQEAKTDSFIWI